MGKIFNEEYCIYKKDVYFEWKKIEWADWETFESCEINLWWGTHSFSNIYFKDKNRVYFKWKELKWSDIGTFTYNDWKYASDKDNIYYEWKKIN